MLIFWGTKRTTRQQGLVADFCPICREVRPFQLLRLGLASHLYFISFGQGKLAGHVMQCTDCRTRYTTDPLKYTTFVAESKTAPMDLEELEQRTYPKLHEAKSARIWLETQIRRSASQLGADERRALLLEPFTLLNPELEVRYASSSTLDKQSGFGCMGTMLLMLGLLALAFLTPETWKDAIVVAVVVVACIGTVYTLVQMALGPGRFLRAKTVPLLARSLEPLEPTQEELQNCLERCQASGMKIGKKVKLPVLWTALGQRAARLAVA